MVKKVKKVVAEKKEPKPRLVTAKTIGQTFGQEVADQFDKAIVTEPKPTFEVGQKVMVVKPSQIHKAYMGAQGHIVKVKGFMVEVKLIIPEKQRGFAIRELRVM